jgi:uncharacterized repeat protein (TIGR03803 family)
MATAQTETVLYSFQNNGKDGILPAAGLVMDAAGDLFGTTSLTYFGGTYGYGTVFKLTQNGNKTILHTFENNGTDGIGPRGALLRDKSGNLYGTTWSGGTYGFGTVFKHAPNGTWTILHSFQGYPTDGNSPVGALVIDSSGNLYGATYDGGQHGYGTIFKLASNGAVTILHSFGYSGVRAVNPGGGLLRDNAGNLYGTTYQGGSVNRGTVFKLTPKGVLSILYSFGTTSTDATLPDAGLVMDSAGNLYGTTTYGGSSGFGTIFKIAPDNTEIVLHSFQNNGTDGGYPYGTLVLDSSGNLYGTADSGGPNSGGIIFRLAPDGTEAILHPFASSSTDGTSPSAGLVWDAAGNLYGTTHNGGTYGFGTVFRLVP